MNNELNVITIEKDVPMPELRNGYNRRKYNFLKNMGVGDSFIINGNTPDYKPKAVRSHVYGRHSNKTQIRYAVRTIKGNTDSPSSIRVWRTI